MGGNGTVGSATYTKLDRDGLDMLAKDKKTWSELKTACTSGIDDMSKLFYSADVNQSFVDFDVDLSSWDTSNVIMMDWMFYNAFKFNQNISKWNTSNVQDMAHMFDDAIKFNQDIGQWDTSSVTNMTGMFYDAQSFNQDISGWDTSNVKSMYHMFWGADAFNQDLSGWNVRNVEECAGFNNEVTGWTEPKPDLKPQCLSSATMLSMGMALVAVLSTML